MYSQKVMDHFMNPRNVGALDAADGVGEVGNPVCGDIMHIEIQVKDNIIEDIKFKTFGCAAAIATSSPDQLNISLQCNFYGVRIPTYSIGNGFYP
jgi:nitrogen fixation NifU-like protein